MARSTATSACTSSFWLVTETYSPVPIEKAPATRPARPVRTIACGDTPPPWTPAINEALVTRPSTAPNTVGRSHPPETSRCRWSHPLASAASVTGDSGPGVDAGASSLFMSGGGLPQWRFRGDRPIVSGGCDGGATAPAQRRPQCSRNARTSRGRCEGPYGEWMRVVVTGGAGFVGRQVVSAAQGAGDDVLVADIADGCDVRDAAATSQALEGADVVIHL